MIRCPFCLATIEPGVDIGIHGRVLKVAGRAEFLTPHERAMIIALMDNPDGVTVEWMVDLFYGGDPTGGPDKPYNVVTGTASTLRKKLAPDYTIPNLARFGLYILKRND